MHSSPSPDPTVQLGVQFADLSAVLSSPDGLGVDLERVVRFAARAVPHAAHCAVTVLRPDRPPQSLSVTDGLAAEVDRLQHRLREGPCLDAAAASTTTLSHEVADDDRWPRFGPACAHRTGVHSILSIRLSVAGEDHAALNFYGRQPHIFDDHDLAVAAIIAPFAALAVEHRLRLHDTHHLQEALASSRQIGTAVGIIMARHLVSSSEALARLKRASQDLNRKLRDIAAEVERTGELPHR